MKNAIVLLAVSSLFSCKMMSQSKTNHVVVEGKSSTNGSEGKNLFSIVGDKVEYRECGQLELDKCKEQPFTQQVSLNVFKSAFDRVASDDILKELTLSYYNPGSRAIERSRQRLATLENKKKAGKLSLDETVEYGDLNTAVIAVETDRRLISKLDFAARRNFFIEDMKSEKEKNYIVDEAKSQKDYWIAYETSLGILASAIFKQAWAAENNKTLDPNQSLQNYVGTHTIAFDIAKALPPQKVMSFRHMFFIDGKRVFDSSVESAATVIKTIKGKPGCDWNRHSEGLPKGVKVYSAFNLGKNSIKKNETNFFFRMPVDIDDYYTIGEEIVCGVFTEPSAANFYTYIEENHKGRPFTLKDFKKAFGDYIENVRIDN